MKIDLEELKEKLRHTPGHNGIFDTDLITRLIEVIEVQREALKTLRNESKGIISAHEIAIRYDYGNTNYKCLEMAWDMADKALKKTDEILKGEKE